MRATGLLAIGLFSCAPALVAQEPARPKVWGTVRVTETTALASEFVPQDLAVGWSFQESGTGGLSRYQTTTTSVRWWAPLRVPSGAAVAALNLEMCDETASGQIAFGLRRTRFEDGVEMAPVGGTGVAPTPGCGYASVSYDPPLTVDNENYDYWLWVRWEGEFSPSLRFQAVHAAYRLQVSPDPAYATFNDIPVGHPLHQFVEALAYWSITAGCGNGNFCPDAPLTRGQMAVFLSKALGL
jgi:hypothetical protein